jgi:hypothetical protein
MDSLKTQHTSVESPAYRFAFPFHISIDPMEKLLLVNFEKDSDSIYIGFEPQVFNDPVNGAGHLIIGWRKDKKVDVYHQPELKPDPEKYCIAGAGLNQMIEVEMQVSIFEVNDFGVQAHYTFTDVIGRDIEIRITEKNRKPRKPFGLLAPMGDAATNPTSLPMVWLHNFYFVRKEETAFTIQIANRSHKPDLLPLKMDGERMTFARYSPQPLIATLNPNYSDLLPIHSLTEGQLNYESGNHSYTLEWRNGSPFVTKMQVNNPIHPLILSFSPSFPCLNALSENSRIKGNFTITGHASLGSLSGTYMLHSDDGRIEVQLVPDKGWKPKTTKFSTRFLFTVAKVFKKWPTTYNWNAVISKMPEGNLKMESQWTRTGRIMKE